MRFRKVNIQRYAIAIALSISLHTFAGLVIQDNVGDAGERSLFGVYSGRLDATLKREGREGWPTSPDGSPNVEAIEGKHGEGWANIETSPALVLPMPPDPRYLASDEVTIKPSVRQDLSPDIGDYLFSTTPGTVVLRLRIGESGYVDEVLIDEGDLPFADLNRLQDGFKQMRFSPGMLEGKPVKTEMRIEVTTEKRPDSGFPAQAPVRSGTP